jgi:UDP-2,3-diacylglucosamine hydrolase
VAAQPLRCGEWLTPASWQRIDLISDLHLAPDTPLTVAAWERYLLTTPADAVIMLGDLFETWVGDDGRHRPFEARCVDILARASRSATLAFMAGNRDFLLGADMFAACRMRELLDPTVLVAFGTRHLLTHGDALCLADTEYLAFRAKVRDRAWQDAFLAMPLDDRRAIARQLRAGSMERRAGRHPEQWVDVDVPMALDWLAAAESTSLIHGHTHRPGTNSLAVGQVRHVLSDWSFDHGGEGRAEVLSLDATGPHRFTLCG